ncbi:hypothetical protein T484DRAFT_1829678 [Baffinella frigidus]|nr:hypothetical protein T484DRAFT_1829678 [Cryptophyta sp. CCMP2293]
MSHGRWHGPNARANTLWTTRVDSVDKCPDYQINLYPSDLQRIVGEAGFRRLWSIPLALKGEKCSEDMEPEEHGYKRVAGYSCARYKRVGVFLRKYTRDTRPFIPFHLDSNSCTGNVALNGDLDYEGGSLLVVEGGEIKAAERREGDATV